VRLVQILLNLCQNAVKFTKDGTVSVNISQIDSKEVSKLKQFHRSKRPATNTLQDLLLAQESHEVAKSDSPKYTAEEQDHLRRNFYYHIMVSDTGIGIPADRITLLFKEFMQADVSTARKYGGTGLGLAICQRLCEMMDGCIWVESALDQGSQFHFIIGVEPAEHGNRSKSFRLAWSETPEILPFFCSQVAA
jgi:signal transduction histidine kinase